MAYKWPDKDPDEVVDYSVDWSRFLGDDTISAATWFVKEADGTKNEFTDTEVVEGLQFVEGTITNTVATVRFGLGTNNKRYSITCRITTSEGLQYERDIFLRIKER